MMVQAMGKAVADVRLRVWAPQGAEVVLLQAGGSGTARPERLPDQGKRQAGDFPTGAWGDESRDYHLVVRVRPVEPATRCWRPGAACGRATRLRGRPWSGPSGPMTTALSTRINRQVAHYTGQQELADAIDDGLEADQEWRRRHRRRQVRASGADRRRVGQQRDGESAGQGSRRRRSRDGAGAPQEPTWRRPTR